MGWFLAYLRWLIAGDASPPVGVRVYRASGPVAFVWANGTGDDAKLEKYERLLLEFQRSGVTVVACETTQAWDGVDVAKAAKYARSLRGIQKVAGIGHSGGGGGILTAGGRDASLFDRIVVLATGRDVFLLPSCPAFFAVGENDRNIDKDHFLRLADSYPGQKTIGVHLTADHFTITRAAGEYALLFGTGDSGFQEINRNPYWSIR